MLKSIKINIYGKVQGVGFRYCALQKANELGLKGFVKNRTDGSVYIEADGEPEVLDKFILWCKIGPSRSQVDDVKVSDIPFNNYKSFGVK
ncbi:MAG TPA: acylphosphatase [Bacteroidales bacterium]|jgi:acylphosphatase|nr:acylphosphatase [Bacteroidales bacterium]